MIQSQWDPAKPSIFPKKLLRLENDKYVGQASQLLIGYAILAAISWQASTLRFSGHCPMDWSTIWEPFRRHWTASWRQNHLSDSLLFDSIAAIPFFLSLATWLRCVLEYSKAALNDQWPKKFGITQESNLLSKDFLSLGSALSPWIL